MKMNMKKMLGMEKDNIAGLDVGSSSVKMVRLSKTDGNYAVKWAEAAEIGDGVITAIKDCLKSCDPKDRLAACSLSGPEVVVRDFRFPLLPKDEIASAVQFEAAQVSPFDIEQAEVDYKLMPRSNEHISGVLVAAKKSQIVNKCQTAKDAGLDCVLVGVDGLEILNCFTELEGNKPGSTTAILNVGYNYSNLIISGGDGLPFIRDINYAGKIITEKLAHEMNISIETLRVILGDNRKVESQQAFHNSLAAACMELTDAIFETIRYCTVNRKTEQIEKIYVCGGFSQTPGFIELLNDRLPASAVLWNPFDKIAWPVERESCRVIQKHGPSFAVAVGLAMRQFGI